MAEWPRLYIRVLMHWLVASLRLEEQDDKKRKRTCQRSRGVIKPGTVPDVISVSYRRTPTDITIPRTRPSHTR